MKQKVVCRWCDTVAWPIVYGLPVDKREENVIYGGCLIGLYQPNFYCPTCEMEW